MKDKGKARRTKTEAAKQPLPQEQIMRNALHGKTASDLQEPGDLPINILDKEIPRAELRDM